LLDKSIPTLIFTEKNCLSEHNLEFITIDFSVNSLQTILQKLYERNIHSILVEGGAQLLSSFIQAGLWDEANIEVSPISIYEGITAPVLAVKPSSIKLYDGHQWLFYKKSCKF